MSMSMPRPLDYVPQLQRQLEETINSISPWQYAKIVDQWCEAQHFADVNEIDFGDRAVFHADLARTE